MIALYANATTINIATMGAKGDGNTDNTFIFQSAIDKCSTQKGTIVIPAGEYLTGPLFLKSNVNILLEQGATILGSKTLSFDIYSGQRRRTTCVTLWGKCREHLHQWGWND